MTTLTMKEEKRLEILYSESDRDQNRLRPIEAGNNQNETPEGDQRWE